jgi:DNA-binding MarR family transcriptional regulator
MKESGSETGIDEAGPRSFCGVDDERIHTFGLLLEAHARLTNLLDADLQASDGISLQTYEVLLRIGRSDGQRVTMSMLASGVALTTGGVTRLADRLERSGLIQRGSCPSDRRVTWLSLTDLGADTLEVATQHHLDSLARHVQSRLDPADLPALHRALDVLRSVPDDPAPADDPTATSTKEDPS